MGRAAADYAEVLAALLPEGHAWNRAPDGRLAALLSAFAPSFSAADGRADDLVREANPGTASELLTDWERVLGLPDACFAGFADEDDFPARRRNARAKLTGIGGQSARYFIERARAAGYEISVSDHPLHTVNSPVSHPLYDTPWRFVWRVTSRGAAARPFTVADPADSPLARWGDPVLECVMNREKPAHTIVIFSYPET